VNFEELLLRAVRLRSVFSWVYLNGSWCLDTWRERSVSGMKALVVLMTGTKNDVECFTVALASAEVLRSCFRLRTVMCSLLHVGWL